MKYLVPIKLKLALVASEEGNIYGIAKIIIDNHSLTTNREEDAYVLTDNELIVQNFTPNAPKLLYLHSSAINNNLEITDYIKEFNEEFLKGIDKYEEVKENNYKIIKRIKIDVLKKMFPTRDVNKLITWRLGDVINKNGQAALNYKNPKFLKTLKTNFIRVSSTDNRRSQSALYENIIRPNIKGNKNKNANSKSKSTFAEVALKSGHYSSEIGEEHNKAKEELVKASSLLDENLKDLVNSGKNDTMILENSKLNLEQQIKNEYKRRALIHHKFILSLIDINFGDAHVGYITISIVQ